MLCVALVETSNGRTAPEVIFMRSTSFRILTVVSILAVAAGWSYLRSVGTGVDMTEAAKAYLATLSDE